MHRQYLLYFINKNASCRKRIARSRMQSIWETYFFFKSVSYFTAKLTKAAATILYILYQTVVEGERKWKGKAGDQKVS